MKPQFVTMCVILYEHYFYNFSPWQKTQAFNSQINGSFRTLLLFSF